MFWDKKVVTVEEPNLIEKKELELDSLRRKSNNALDVVTHTINELSTVNEQIDLVISEIENEKAQLEKTEAGLHNTKSHNSKIINKFKALIEE